MSLRYRQKESLGPDGNKVTHLFAKKFRMRPVTYNLLLDIGAFEPIGYLVSTLEHMVTLIVLQAR